MVEVLLDNDLLASLPLWCTPISSGCYTSSIQMKKIAATLVFEEAKLAVSLLGRKVTGQALDGGSVASVVVN